MRPIAVLLFAVLGVLSFQGCSSEDGEKPGEATTCPGSAKFCPSPGTGTPCCVADKCGLDFSMGCVLTTSDAGG
jgi:hypothetical protein